jgi:hypothetical protein
MLVGVVLFVLRRARDEGGYGSVGALGGARNEGRPLRLELQTAVS